MKIELDISYYQYLLDSFSESYINEKEIINKFELKTDIAKIITPSISEENLDKTFNWKESKNKEPLPIPSLIADIKSNSISWKYDFEKNLKIDRYSNILLSKEQFEKCCLVNIIKTEEKISFKRTLIKLDVIINNINITLIDKFLSENFQKYIEAIKEENNYFQKLKTIRKGVNLIVYMIKVIQIIAIIAVIIIEFKKIFSTNNINSVTNIIIFIAINWFVNKFLNLKNDIFDILTERKLFNKKN